MPPHPHPNQDRDKSPSLEDLKDDINEMTKALDEIQARLPELIDQLKLLQASSGGAGDTPAPSPDPASSTGA